MTTPHPYHRYEKVQEKWYGDVPTLLALVMGFVSTVITFVQLIIMW